MQDQDTGGEGHGRPASGGFQGDTQDADRIEQADLRIRTITIREGIIDIIRAAAANLGDGDGRIFEAPITDNPAEGFFQGAGQNTSPMLLIPA